MADELTTQEVKETLGESNDVGIGELDNTTEIPDTALFIVEDEQNTKSISLESLRRNLITDDDTPSDTKVYSSEKTLEMIESYKSELNQELAKTNTDVNYIKENYATTENVNTQITEIKENMFTQTDRENIEKALESKRDKNTLITSSDLDASSDQHKIQLKNLSEEVLSAMTGQTPVSLVRSPSGGWTSESIAKGAITVEKLAASYRFRGQIIDGSMNDIIEDGIYVVGPNVEGVPKLDENDTEAKLLEVSLFGTNKEFIKQQVEYLYQLEDRPYFVRKGKTLNIHNLEFNTIYQISGNFKINSSIMGDVITDRGVISSGNLYEHTAEGSYKVLKGVENLPTATDDYFVTISKFDDYYVYEARLHSDVSCVVYISYTHQNEYGIDIATKWFKITNVNKSKFDNQRIHLFGDGICFGLGSTDISTKAYPYILFDTYGFKVFNHAINDATMGNYGVVTMEERSVITQVKNTAFEDNDIAVVFAGTNDFKLGTCPIGNNTDMKDTTFKGSLNLVIKGIFESNPSVKILLVTPMFRARMDAGDGRDSDSTKINSRYLSDYATAILDIAKINHVPVLDMMNEGLINKYNYNKWLGDDGLYLNDDGQSYFATRLYDRLLGLY